MNDTRARRRQINRSFDGPIDEQRNEQRNEQDENARTAIKTPPFRWSVIPARRRLGV
jgi:hypothetical protein